MTDSGWDRSAKAWIASIGENGDWGREHVLDRVMVERVRRGGFRRALDVGCGEGRFCRVMQEMGITTVGVDPTHALLNQAKSRDPDGDYGLAKAENLPFEDAAFDLIVSYLTLIDIRDFGAAIAEMARALKPGGSILVANLTGYNTASSGQGWIDGANGTRLLFPMDRYSEEFSFVLAWKGIEITNWHRPLSAYMKTFIREGLTLTYFDEPLALTGDRGKAALYAKAPWFLVMEWTKPPAPGSA